MGRVSNETSLIVALLKEKAKAEKSLALRQAKILKEEVESTHFLKGIDWTLNALDEIIDKEIVQK